MRLNYEDSEKLEELADEYGIKVSTYCRAILKAGFLGYLIRDYPNIILTI